MSAKFDQQSPRHGSRVADVLLQDKYRKLTRDHIEALPRLFQRLTGLELSLAWAPAWPHQWQARDLPTHSWVCRRSHAGSDGGVAGCQRCGTRHLALTLQAAYKGHFFTCDLGVRNFWFPIIVRHCTVAIASVQALADDDGPSAGQGAGFRRGPDHPQGWAGAKQVGRQQFEQAAGLLQLIFQHVQTSALADLRKEDLTKAQRALLELQTVAARLREDLNGLMPTFRRGSPVTQTQSRAEVIVHAVLQRVQQDYAQPLTLQECARGLHLNASYLSALFSRSVGLSFKTLLTGVRLERARELLSEPARSISEVAIAVGYASENRFRLAFKGATGLSPKVWRETLKMEPPSAAHRPA